MFTVFSLIAINPYCFDHSIELIIDIQSRFVYESSVYHLQSRELTSMSLQSIDRGASGCDNGMRPSVGRARHGMLVYDASFGDMNR